MFFLTAIPIATSTFWLTIAGEAGVIGAFLSKGSEKYAKANLGVEKDVGQFAREGSYHVERTFNVDDSFQEAEYISGILKNSGCVDEAERLKHNFSELISYNAVSAFANEECRRIGFAAGKDYWETKYGQMQSYAKYFLGVEGKLSIAVNLWKKKDANVRDDRVVRNTPLVFEGGISFIEPGWHKGGFTSAEEYFKTGDKMDTDTRKLAKALYMKNAHEAFEAVYEEYVSYLNIYETALKQFNK